MSTKDSGNNYGSIKFEREYGGGHHNTVDAEEDILIIVGESIVRRLSSIDTLLSGVSRPKCGKITIF